MPRVSPAAGAAQPLRPRHTLPPGIYGRSFLPLWGHGGLSPPSGAKRLPGVSGSCGFQALSGLARVAPHSSVTGELSTLIFRQFTWGPRTLRRFDHLPE